MIFLLTHIQYEYTNNKNSNALEFSSTNKIKEKTDTQFDNIVYSS